MNEQTKYPELKKLVCPTCGKVVVANWQGNVSAHYPPGGHVQGAVACKGSGKVVLGG